MPKIKTKQSIDKRFKITKTKKVMKRTCGQDHFNSRESGSTKRAKRSDSAISETEGRNIRRLLPYS